MAKRAVDSTLRRILNYTAEIFISIFMLVFICIPLAFTIPMWFEYVLFDVPRTELAINPAAWFGLDGTLWITLLLGLVSLSIGYLYIIKINPGDASASEEDAEEYDVEDEEEDVSDDVVVDHIPIEEEDVKDIPLEDQEEEEEEDYLLDAIEEELEEENEEEESEAD